LAIDSYSLHSGTAMNHNPKYLGKKQTQFDAIPISISRKNLYDSIVYLSKYSENRNVNLYLENNVIEHYNSKEANNRYHFISFKDSDFIIQLMNKFKIGILLDVGHLKITSKSLKFNSKKFVEKYSKHIKIVHLSDNNGLIDQNKILTKKSWFWNFIPWQQIEYVSLELKNYSYNKLISQVKFVENQINKYI